MVWTADKGSGILDGINAKWAAKTSGTTITICISQILDQIPESGEILAGPAFHRSLDADFQSASSKATAFERPQVTST